MRRYLTILAMATLASCSGSSGKDETAGDGPTDGGDDDDTACTNSVIEMFPADADNDVYYKTDVRFRLAAEDTTATITVTDAAGNTVNGSSTVESTLVAWAGDDFSPSTTYTATLVYECGEAPVTWTTSDTGTAVAVDVTGMVYNLDLTSGEWIEPAGVGDLLATQLGDVEVLISPTSVSATQIEMLGGLGDGTGNQDECSPTFAFPAADWTDPFFQLQADSLDLDIAGFVVTVDDLDLSGAFSPNGDRIQGAVLKGAIDTRPLVDLIAPGGTEDAVCQLVATFGVACQECQDGSGPYCLSVHVDSIDAGRVSGADPLVPITDADIKANVNCQ